MQKNIRSALVMVWVALPVWPVAASMLPDIGTTEGYLARLLVNEVPFPGERGYHSEADTMAAIDQLAVVLDRRLRQIPVPYKQEEIASVNASNLIDIITAGGVKGQFDGFYRDASGRPAMVPRVTDRVDRLIGIAGQGEPGRFARLLDHANAVATRYVQDQLEPSDRHAPVRMAQGQPATGGSFAWMTDEQRFHPGGNFLRIGDQDQGALGGNRFFTLRKDPK